MTRASASDPIDGARTGDSPARGTAGGVPSDHSRFPLRLRRREPDESVGGERSVNRIIVARPPQGSKRSDHVILLPLRSGAATTAGMAGAAARHDGEATRHGVDMTPGLEREIVDRDGYGAERGSLADARRGAAPHRRPRRSAVAPGGTGRGDCRGRSRPRGCPQPLSRPLAQRRGPQVAGRCPRAHRAAGGADRGASQDHRGTGQPVPDDQRPQGAGRIRMPHSTTAVGRLRRHAAPRGLALDRQLLPRGRGNFAAAGLPVGCGAAGGHEPGTFPLARGLGGRPGRHPPHTGHGKQRQGDLRCLPCPGARRAKPDPQSVLGIRELHRAPRRHRTGPGADIRGAQRGRKQDGARVRMRLRVGRNAGGRRLAQALARHPDLRRRSAGMSDASLQRLWRAQHPGHRRQACAAHSQRHGHRFRDRRLRQGQRCAERRLQTRSPAEPICPGTGTSASRAWGRSTISGFHRLPTFSARSSTRNTWRWAPTTSC